jgi:hypothetical protein
MSEDRETKIIEDEIEENELNQEKNLRDEIFEKLKTSMIDEKRLIGRFYDFCEEHTNFEYDEMGMNMEEGKDILKKADKIRDKVLISIQEKLFYIFENVETNTLTNIISFDLDAREFKYRVVIEVFKDSFNLEIT